MKSSTLLTYLGLTLAVLFSRPALADCTPGETRCGADSEVERCTSDHTWNTEPSNLCNRSIPNPPTDDRRYNDRGRDELARGGCTSGISRCGADGLVERCTDSNTWSTEPGSACTR
jgi:hypothetical protein